MRSLFFVSLALLANFVAAHGPVWSRRHAGRAPLVGDPIQQNITSRGLEKRFDGARFTFYDAGLGACGKVNSNADFIVAMNSGQFAGGAHCFQTITITVNGKSTSAQVADECPGCPFAGLDFSRGLFDFFAPESAGVLTGSWTFGGGAPAAPPKPTPTPTHTPPPPPKTTELPKSTYTPPTTTHTSTSSAASSSALSTVVSASKSTSAAAVTSSVAVPPQLTTLEQMYLAYIQMGGIALSAGGGSASA
ncbi:hypothetical protein M413DRAFT_106763 [Hebeloma cylindrosporum]|uniref:RlpA-like protein double-psi beta-barrel domain-containing protein n=1 Tax=Hebeloma cylindrosporum TaxID=76867 RepID=A0A0C3CZV2_HEBCY|nr:hypothetical protein M413DRAFT_106763 [Hebeloma cylindrosporum h7]